MPATRFAHRCGLWPAPSLRQANAILVRVGRQAIMIFNPYTVIDVFLCGLRLVCAIAVMALGIQMLRPAAINGDQRSHFEGRGYLVMAVAALLLSLSLMAWPLLYLVLHSYIPQWPGVMCIYGVTQIGRGRSDFGRFLPAILTAIEWLRPAVIFSVGAWILMYQQARRAGEGITSRKATAAILFLAVLSGIDSGLEMTYLLSPKRAAQPMGGCCSLAQSTNRGVSGYFTDHHGGAPRWLWGSAIVVIGGLILGSGVLLVSRPMDIVQRRAPLWMFSAMAICGLVILTIFVVDIAAPRLLRLPHHHCVYCLFTEIPESLLAFMGLIVGSFCTLWSGLLAFASSKGESTAARSTMLRLWRCGLVGYLSFLAMLSLEMALAR